MPDPFNPFSYGSAGTPMFGGSSGFSTSRSPQSAFNIPPSLAQFQSYPQGRAGQLNPAMRSQGRPSAFGPGFGSQGQFGQYPDSGMQGQGQDSGFMGLAQPLDPGGIYGDQKWAPGNGIDIFVRRGSKVYAMFDGEMAPYGVPSPVGTVPGFTLRGQNGLTMQGLHARPVAQGRVRKGQVVAIVDDPGLDILGPYQGMPDGFQHLDLTIGHGGPFQVTGGDINAGQLLGRMGYPGRKVPGQTRGPQGGPMGGMGGGGFGMGMPFGGGMGGPFGMPGMGMGGPGGMPGMGMGMPPMMPGMGGGGMGMGMMPPNPFMMGGGGGFGGGGFGGGFGGPGPMMGQFGGGFRPF